jgi:hypothetical protein
MSDERQAKDEEVLVEARRWLFRIVHEPKREDRAYAAGHLLTALAERYDDEPGVGLFAALSEWLGRSDEVSKRVWSSYAAAAEHVRLAYVLGYVHADNGTAPTLPDDAPEWAQVEEISDPGNLIPPAPGIP